jgi:hypothetical protein
LYVTDCNNRQKEKQMVLKNSTIIRISKEASEKFATLQRSRPQDSSNAQTFDYLLQFHEQMQEFKPHPRKISSIGRVPGPEQVHSRIIVAGEDTP